MAMAFLARFPPSSGWEIDIMATDLSTRVLERAQAAVWPIDKAKEIPDGLSQGLHAPGHRSRRGPHEGGPARPLAWCASIG